MCNTYYVCITHVVFGATGHLLQLAIDTEKRSDKKVPQCSCGRLGLLSSLFCLLYLGTGLRDLTSAESQPCPRGVQKNVLFRQLSACCSVAACFVREKMGWSRPLHPPLIPSKGIPQPPKTPHGHLSMAQTCTRTSGQALHRCVLHAVR